MRFRPPLAALLLMLAGPAAADGIDCTKLKSTLAPFAIDYQVRRSTPKGPLTTNEQSQIFRKAHETVSYNVIGPGHYMRIRSAATPLFITESFTSSPPKLRRWTYSIDPNVDWLAKRQRLEFTAEQREEDGTVFLQGHGTVAFVGTSRLAALGCSFEIVKIARTLNGTAAGRPLANRTDVWVSPELRASLFTRIEDDAGWASYTTTGITFDFTPVE